MPKLTKKIPNLKLVLTGGGFNKKIPWVINKGIVKKRDLYNLIYYSKCMCVPLKFGSGTRIKIIEAMAIGAIVVSTPKGIEGIDLKTKNPPFITGSTKKIISTIVTIINKNKIIKKKSIEQRDYYIEKYSMKKITGNFIKQNIKLV